MHTMVLFKEFTSKLKGYLSNGVCIIIIILAGLEGDLCFTIEIILKINIIDDL